jgi:hypothetical protein
MPSDAEQEWSEEEEDFSGFLIKQGGARGGFKNWSGLILIITIRQRLLIDSNAPRITGREGGSSSGATVSTTTK